MGDSSTDGVPRRRSSVAYDPARDTFTEIPDTIPENAVSDSPRQHHKPSPYTAPAELDPAQVSSETPQPSSHRSRVPKSALDLPRVPKRNREEGEVSAPRLADSAYSRRPDNRDSKRRRSRSPRRDDRRQRDRPSDRGVYSRRSPPRRRSPRDPSPIRRSPSPIRRSPPRSDQHRPGGRQGVGRIIDMEGLRRQREARSGQPAPQPTNRGVQDVSNQFYNTRPEWVKTHGRDWRKNESQIKGLRSFNNWIKSCMIQKFSPEEPEEDEDAGWGQEAKPVEAQKPLRVLDIGCGKGGDLGKWDKLPTFLELYVGLDPAETSIRQAGQRFDEMSQDRRRTRPMFDGRFYVKDCFGEGIEDVSIMSQVGFDPNVGNGMVSRFGGGGFDVVSMMFSMHYAFEDMEKVRNMLKNVAGSLKKGGRFIGVVPNSDMLAENAKKWFEKSKGEKNGRGDGEHGEATEAPSWGNSIYKVTFPPTPDNEHVLKPSEDGSIQFRPPTGWKYTYWMAEAVDVPEFVVPWEWFRSIAESYNLEQRYRKGFLDIWENEKVEGEMWELASRMGVVDTKVRRVTKDGRPWRAPERPDDPKEEYVLVPPPGDKGVREVMSQEEREAVAFYAGFCFVKV